MNEAEAYLKRANKIRFQHFRDGYASEKQKPEVPCPAVAPQQQQGVLPPKKNTKRPRSPAAPAPPVTLPAHGKPRMSLIDKWFPGSTLMQATVESCHAPPAEVVASTVQRIVSARESMILLRSGVEDLESVLDELKSATFGRGVAGAVLAPNEIKCVVTRDTAPGVGEALAQFAKEAGHSVGFVRSQVRQLMQRKAMVHAQDTSSVKRWHEFLNVHGPEAGKAPATRDFLWLGSANLTTFFTVLLQRFLRGIRESTKTATGKGKPEELSSAAEADEEKRVLLDINDAEEEKKLLAAAESAEDKSWLQKRQPMLMAAEGHTVTPASQVTHPTTESQCQLLVFLRFLMPTEAVPEGQATGIDVSPSLHSTGYGVWLLACLVALDIPLDPDTDRLVHDLFRTSCDQVRVFGEWKGMHGEQPGLLLSSLRQVEQECGPGVWPKAYTSLEDVGTSELLALYTLIIVLAKLFRQNQNRLIPL